MTIKILENSKIPFSEMVNTNENITLVENNNIISSEIEIAEKLNVFFSNIVKELKIQIRKPKTAISLVQNISNLI